ncbi:protein SPT2 homolog [Rhynchocyon petersi]
MAAAAAAAGTRPTPDSVLQRPGCTRGQKRYSLAVGPPKKDPKVKGVQSAAVQAFLRRKEEELRQKALEEKRRKEELLKKRIELKHDKKARAMAKRTKDNFHGYNGIPVEEKSKKRQTLENQTSQETDQEQVLEEEDDFLEYDQAESEPEYEEEPEPPRGECKPKLPLKSAPPPMNFTDLLRLAEKKQYEPVEIKVVKKTEERPMTAEELREREFLERKHKKRKLEIDSRLPPTVSKKAPSQKESMSSKVCRGSGDKIPPFKGTPLPQIEKKPRPSTTSEKHLGLSSSKPMTGERTKTVSGNNSQPSLREGRDKPVFNGTGKSQASTYSPSIQKSSASRTQKSTAEHKAKKSPPHPSHSRPGPLVTPNTKMKNPGVRQPVSSSSSAPGRPSTGIARPTTTYGPGSKRQNGSSSTGSERSMSGTKRPASDSHPSSRTVSGPGRPISGSNGSGRPVDSSGGPGRPVSSPHDLRRPGSGSGPPRQSGGGPGRPGSGLFSTGQNVRPASSLRPGQTGPPMKPKCTVVSETISSKNIISRSSNGQVNGMKPPLSGYRSVQGPQRLSLSGYKRQRDYYDEEEEDDDYDSEMEDFIDDEGEPQEEISKHIREIFGYDRKKYKDESDYALRYMESSWREQQKEEAKSLRLGMQEDLEEMRREEEMMKRQKAKKLKRR